MNTVKNRVKIIKNYNKKYNKKIKIISAIVIKSNSKK